MTYHFYIDEAGHLNNNTSVFINGCIRTDAPLEIEANLTQFWNEIEDNIYFSSSIDKIKSQGLHAVENHPDVRAKIYSILPLMNFRSYFTIINKKSKWYQQISKKQKMEDIYLLTIKKIIKDRLRQKNKKLIFNFEELSFPDESQTKLLDRFFNPYLGKVDLEYNIVTKESKLMSLTDYMNYIFFKLLDDPKKKEQRMIENFDLIAPKIALIHMVHNDQYLNRQKGITIENICKLYGG